MNKILLLVAVFVSLQPSLGRAEDASSALRELLRGSSSGGIVVDDGFGSFGRPSPTRTPSSNPEPEPTATGTPIATGGLSKACPSVRSVSRLEVWKASASAEFSASDPRRKSTSFIVRTGGSRPTTSCINVYDKAGNLIHRLGAYNPPGNYAARYYGGWGCGDKQSAGAVASRASSATKSSEIYLKVTSRTCVKVPSANRCVNSSSC